jgi:hypothetical protein
LLGYKTIVKSSTTLINVSFCLSSCDSFFQNVYFLYAQLQVVHALNQIIDSVSKLVHFTFQIGDRQAKERFSTVVSSTLPATVLLSCLKIKLPTPEDKEE